MMHNLAVLITKKIKLETVCGMNKNLLRKQQVIVIVYTLQQSVPNL